MKTEKELKLKAAMLHYLGTIKTERSLTKSSKLYNIKRQDLATYLRNNGYTIINYQNRSRLNETVFDKIDTEEKAYWLGFLYADGNISISGNRLEVRLADKDYHHLEKFKEFLNLETKIRKGTTKTYAFCHLSVRNKHLWNMLKDKGCIPRKSLVLEWPYNVIKNKSLLIHFLRGYIDGDGCLYIRYPKKEYSLRTIIEIVGTYDFLQQVKVFLGGQGTIENKTTKNWANKAFRLRFNSVFSRQLARILYENAHVYLDRKYQKYKEFCRLEEESSRAQSSKIGESWNANTEVNLEITKGSKSPQSVAIE